MKQENVRTRNQVVVAAIVGFVALGLVGTLTAQPTREMAIGVVNVDEIVKSANEFKAMISQLEAKKDGYEKELESQKEKVNAKREELTAQRDMLSEEELQKENARLNKLINGVVDDAKAKSRELASEQERLLQPLLVKANTAIKDVAEENGLHIVLKRAEIAYCANSYDITDDVIAELNKAAN